ncbi:TOBE domain-containing protein [Tumidithrix elongata RA019]|uniref:TOBE domain-containing protein n=1 Tax=Tumidithrix elongata BACA0141 TaxID=2716417 RepID=A0AAW9Q518_9CYAN|nr:TOBE domain-containing protein [Tumidithrix elongata RA019]
MKISARNSFKGMVKKVKIGAVSAEISVEIAPSIHVISTITKSSAETLELEEGKEAYVVIKASDVIVATD